MGFVPHAEAGRCQQLEEESRIANTFAKFVGYAKQLGVASALGFVSTRCWRKDELFHCIDLGTWTLCKCLNLGKTMDWSREPLISEEKAVRLIHGGALHAPSLGCPSSC
mmetsp:Transcript_30237/g.48843  ORF Transcript_30237/g.48843 Transcript_30237/m.48843 type:complete len:109 (-) Transcript_30237:33-359(-)